MYIYREVAPPVVLGVVVGGLLIFAGIYVFTSLLIVGLFLAGAALYDRSNPAVIPGVTGWWLTVGVICILFAILGYSKGLLFVVP